MGNLVNLEYNTKVRGGLHVGGFWEKLEKRFGSLFAGEKSELVRIRFGFPLRRCV
jgi:hypothetical protein